MRGKTSGMSSTGPAGMTSQTGWQCDMIVNDPQRGIADEENLSLHLTFDWFQTRWQRLMSAEGQATRGQAQLML